MPLDQRGVDDCGALGAIFTKLGLLPAADDHRRVLAVITYLKNA